MPVIFLPDRGIVAVAGADARTFLNGLVTADMDKVAPGKPAFAALLSPQGKILCDFFVVEADAADGGGFYLDCPRVLADDLVQRLGLYRLRARVGIDNMSATLGVGAVVAPAQYDPEDWLPFVDPRLPALGTRLIGPREALEAAGGDPVLYHRHRIGLVVPEGGKDFAYSDAFPHEVLMDQLGGVDFHKGCYVGQEIVSRMEHRGTARTRIVRAVYDGGFAPSEGVDVFVGERIIGKTGSQAAGAGLATIRIDRYADAVAAGQPVMAGGIGLTAEVPPYARFAITSGEGA